MIYYICIHTHSGLADTENLYKFFTHSLIDLAEELEKYGVKYLFPEEVHKPSIISIWKFEGGYIKPYIEKPGGVFEIYFPV